MLWPKEAGRFIAGRAKDVFICEEGVRSCANAIVAAAQDGKLDMESFKQNEVLPLSNNLTLEQLTNWTFLVDALNFSFWTKKGCPKYNVTHKGKTRSGYLAMVTAINRAVDEGKPVYDPKYYSRLTIDEMKIIFRSDNESSMPLMEKRVEIVAEVGSKLVNEFEGTFQTVLEKANGSAIKLVDIIITNFPSFRDIHTYDNEKVGILKRAQILAADLALLHYDKENSIFHDLDELSMFADYRVPQSLVHFGVMSYSSSLLEKLNNEYLFNSGDIEEVEIRGTAIHAVELIVEQIRNIFMEKKIENLNINSIKVDFFLWDYRLQNAETLECVPYHKTRHIYY